MTAEFAHGNHRKAAWIRIRDALAEREGDRLIDRTISKVRQPLSHTLQRQLRREIAKRDSEGQTMALPPKPAVDTLAISGKGMGDCRFRALV